MHFTLDVQGTVGDVAVHHADGVLTRTGNAKGTATVEQSGAAVEVQFVVVGDKLYVKGPTGSRSPRRPVRWAPWCPGCPTT